MQLITKARLEEITKENYQAVYEFCCAHLKNTNDAADVTQNVFLILMKKSDSIEDINIRSWLFGTASRKIKEKYRKDKIQTRFVSFDECGNIESADPELYEMLDSDIDEGIIISAKEKLLSKLKPEERELLIDIYEKKLKHSEIGKKLGLSEKAVTVRTLRLRKKIADLVELSFIFIGFILIKLGIL